VEGLALELVGETFADELEKEALTDCGVVGLEPRA
jgi:hypothetical protein